MRLLAYNDELPAPDVIVAPVRPVLQPQVRGLGDLLPVTLRVGAEHDLSDLARALVNAAYTRVDLVERRGEFAVRGGILDVFPPTEEHPVRVDFFGDEVDEIRAFAVADQRSFGDPITEVVASPCRELLITDEVKARAAALADATSCIQGNLTEMPDKIAQGHAVDGMEALSAALVDGLELLIDVVPANTWCRSPTPPGARSGARTGADQPGVSAGVMGRGGRGRQGAHRPGRRRVPRVGRRAAACAWAGPGLAVAVAGRPRPRPWPPSTTGRPHRSRHRRVRPGRCRVAHCGGP